PVWRWYAHRLSDQSDEAWGIVALVTAMAFIFRRRAETDPDKRALWLPSILNLCYALSYGFLSPLPRAAIACAAIAATISAIHFDEKLNLGIFGLLLLA